MKFLVEINPEFDETPDDLLECIVEGALRGNHLHGTVTILDDDEVEFLRWFYSNADFGPADGDVRAWLHQRYTDETGKPIPAGYVEEE